MSWFKRKEKGISTPTEKKMDIPKGLWYKTPNGNIVDAKELERNFYVSPEDGYHTRIGSKEYFSILFDKGKFTEINATLSSLDPLKFKDTKKYADRIKDSKKKTELNDAIRTSYGRLDNKELLIAAMDFSFIAGSMGSVVGEKIVRAIDHCLEHRKPLMIISKSGGARMMEAAFSLMQLAKISSKLSQLSKSKIPYISLLTDPTTGGATASFSMLGDINIAEPGALIGFAGPRVIRETIGRDLPLGFQRSEFLLEKGFIDFIVHRKDLKAIVSSFIDKVFSY